MPNIKTLGVHFDLPLKQYEVAAFRGAIINLVGKDKIAFHNHKSEGGFIHKYPKIQYKTKNNKAYILSLGEGIEELYSIFSEEKINLKLRNKNYSVEVENINLSKPFLQVWDKDFYYQINDWLALNEVNFSIYLNIESEVERIQFLEKILLGNMLSMAKGLNWKVDKKIELTIIKIKAEKTIPYKNIKMKAFVLKFKTNLFLPALIGLGKGASTGFGVVHPINSNNHHE